MRRHLLTAALALTFGVLMMASDASACHKRKAACAPAACAPVSYCAPAPCPAPKKHCFKMPKLKRGGLCHKKANCEQVVYAPAPCGAYAAPQAAYAAPQAAYAAPQVIQPMPQAPTK
jgi:hypothetical protein